MPDEFVLTLIDNQIIDEKTNIDGGSNHPIKHHIHESHGEFKGFVGVENESFTNNIKRSSVKK